jgi:hypothetical protein
MLSASKLYQSVSITGLGGGKARVGKDRGAFFPDLADRVDRANATIPRAVTRQAIPPAGADPGRIATFSHKGC